MVQGTGHTASDYGVPKDTYEGRIHFRIRADALKRNLMELPHEGITLGGDLLHGHRAKWGPMGRRPFDTPDFKRERTYIQASAYALVATDCRLWRVKTSPAHERDAGIGKDLDRFPPSGFPDVQRATSGSHFPMIHGVAFNELFPTRYAVANLQYRYEALFFLYPYVEATWGLGRERLCSPPAPP